MLIDLVLLAAVTGTFLGIESSSLSSWVKVSIDPRALLLLLAYFSFFEGSASGQTVGKKLLNIRVVDLDNGQTIWIRSCCGAKRRGLLHISDSPARLSVDALGRGKADLARQGRLLSRRSDRRISSRQVARLKPSPSIAATGDRGFAGRLPWSLWLTTALLLATAVPPALPVGIGFRGFIEAVTYATVGALVASRHPQNPIGWLFCALGFVIALEFFGTEYLDMGGPGFHAVLPEPQWLAWVTHASTEISVPLFVLVLLLFPHRRVLSPNWRLVGYLAVAAGVFNLVSTILLAAASAGQFPSVTERLPSQTHDLLRAMLDLYGGVMAALLISSTVCVFLRQRRARGDERQQLKWFTCAVAIVVAVGVAGIALTGGDADLALWVTPLIPITAGIAIFRYRLYDIDVIINRTLVYGVLTVSLGAVYVTGVFLLQQLLSPITEESPLAVAGATLFVAALFRPARSGIQGHIDRRFYRAKFDVRATLEAFSADLQHEADLEILTGELLEVVQETMQPDGAWPLLQETRDVAINESDDHRPSRR
jgi:RDD family